MNYANPDDCPFCGSDYLAIVEIPPAASHLNTLTTFHVECLTCRMQGPQAREPQSRDGAIAAWDAVEKQIGRFPMPINDRDLLAKRVAELERRLGRAVKVLEVLGQPRAAVDIWLDSDGPIVRDSLTKQENP